MLKIAYHPIYQHPLPEGHRFPMLKYELIPKQLLHEGIITELNLFEPKPASDEDILLTHTHSYVNDLKSLSLDASHIRRIGFPLSQELISREWILVQGTLDAAIYALENGVALNVAGGTHHAFANKGEGFCLLNDIAVAANVLLHKKLANKIAIIDLDVHQGNGTASIFAKNPHVFTCSMHGKNNYPFHKEASDLDIELEDGTSDEVYLNLLENSLNKIFEKIKPDFVFYLSGVDILFTDKFGKLNISKEACMGRDALVFERCKMHQVPVAVAMGGGYSPNIKDIVDAHCNTFKMAASFFFD